METSDISKELLQTAKGLACCMELSYWLKGQNHWSTEQRSEWESALMRQVFVLTSEMEELIQTVKFIPEV